MKRFTQYLYECREEQKVRNVGFVKGEFRPDSGKLTIQARGADTRLGGDMQVFLFYPKGEEYEAVLQGTVSKRSPVLNYTLVFDRGDMGEAETTEDIIGLLLLDDSGKHYMAVWNGETVNTGDIRQIQAKEKEEEKNVEEKESEVSEQSGAEPSGYVCEKIQRKDLARLPRKAWYPANTNFLLHGFYNYHHLLWIEEEEEIYIGVPGVCHAREIQAAKAFGFTEFRTAAEVDGEAEEERSEPGDFGYFCRRIIRNK